MIIIVNEERLNMIQNVIDNNYDLLVEAFKSIITNARVLLKDIDVLNGIITLKDFKTTSFEQYVTLNNVFADCDYTIIDDQIFASTERHCNHPISPGYNLLIKDSFEFLEITFLLEKHHVDVSDIKQIYALYGQGWFMNIHLNLGVMQIDMKMLLDENIKMADFYFGINEYENVIEDKNDVEIEDDIVMSAVSDSILGVRERSNSTDHNPSPIKRARH